MSDSMMYMYIAGILKEQDANIKENKVLQQNFIKFWCTCILIGLSIYSITFVSPLIV